MSKRHAREHGRILSVDEETLGSVLVADAASGATTLTVDDAAEFEDDGTGGWLSVNDQVIEYDTVDDDAGTIHLKTALSAAADDGDPVYVWSKLYATPATVKTALVMVDGEDDNTDPIHATLAEAVQDLEEGLRGEAGESCTLVRVSDDEWEITAVSGRPTAAKGVKFAQYTHIVTVSGAQQFTLPFEPIDNSEHLYWNGLYQASAEWSRTGRTVTVPDAESFLHVNDELTVEYAYRAGLAAPSNVLVDWQAPGWTYMFTTVSVDVNRSAVGYDDSSWSTGAAAFGNAPGHPSNYPADQKSGWPDKSTIWTVTPSGANGNNHRIWLRRHITCNVEDTIVVRARIDNAVAIYWNGTLVGTGANNDFTPIEVQVPAGLVVAGDNVLAVRGEDYGLDDYLDVQVTKEGA